MTGLVAQLQVNAQNSRSESRCAEAVSENGVSESERGQKTYCTISRVLHLVELHMLLLSSAGSTEP